MAQTPTLFIRADASPTIGLGHALRCATLAEAWKADGRAARLCADELTDLVRLRYESLGVQVDDGSAVDEAVPGDVVVFDGYRLDPAHEDAAAHRGALVAAFDDLGDPHASCSIVVDAQPLPDRAPRSGASTTELLGSTYAPVSPRFAAARRRRHPDAATALVVFGGTDPTGRSEAAARALRSAGRRVRVVLSGATAALDDRRRALVDAGCEVVVDVDVARFVDDVAVAVSSASTVCLELLAAGVPVAAACVVDNQRAIHRALVALGAVVDLDDCEDVVDATDRARIIGAGSRFDGFGPARIVEAFQARLEGIPVLRPAVARDVDVVFDLANEPSVRASSFTTEPIAPSQHAHWFRQRVAQERPSLWLACEGHEVLGQGRLDAIGPAECCVSVSVAARSRGRGIARSILSGLEREAARRGIRALVAEIKTTNKASIKLFDGCGYRFVEPFIQGGSDALRFVKEL